MHDAEQAVRAFGSLCDQGPYDADQMIESWEIDGCFGSDDSHYRGVEEIREFFGDLVATFTLHYFTNLRVEIDGGLDSATADCYGFEIPVIGGRGHIAGFTHRIRSRKDGDVWRWTDWQQSIGFLGLANSGWSPDAPRIEQQGSKGA